MRRPHFLVTAATVLAFSCRDEVPQPVPSGSPVPKIRQTTTQSPTSPKPIPLFRYADGMDSFRSAKGFRFTLTEGDVTVSGEMARPAIAAERVHFRKGGNEWLGVARASGLQWYRQKKGHWVPEPQPPAYADRVFQRVTVAFDPQKVEPEALLLASESLGGEVCQHYRFTNANTREVHDVWIRRRDGSIARVSITSKRESVTLSIGSQIAPEEVPDPSR